jgi:HAD superfamily hydrolase (TIGR01549 family)
MATERVVIFDLDGTLVDSDEALVGAFVALGVPREEVTFGHLLVDECRRLGLDVEEYKAAYDPRLVQPFPGVDEVLAELARWAVCSNKVGEAGRSELAHLGWRPEVALFADAFDGPKSLPPVLDRLGVAPGEVLFVGDTEHDRRCASEVGVTFALAAWNPRACAEPGDLVLDAPADLLSWLASPAR